MTDARIRRLEDRFAIQDLVVNYATLLDDRRYGAVGDLFTQDGVFASPNSTTTGREEIAENFRVKLAGYTWTLHDPHGHSVEFVDDDHARGTLIGYSELGNDEMSLCTSIRYLDDYRREDGHWRFARRNVLTLYGMSMQDWATGGLQAAERKRWPGRPCGLAELPDHPRQAHIGYPG